MEKTPGATSVGGCYSQNYGIGVHDCSRRRENKSVRNDRFHRSRHPRSRPWLPLVCGFFSVLLGCGGPLSLEFAPTEGPSGEAAPLRVSVVRLIPSGQVYETAVAFGVANPPRQSTLRFAQAGRVSVVAKQTGDRVVAGERLARLFLAGPEAELQALTERKVVAQEEIVSVSRGETSLGDPQRRMRLEEELLTIDRRIQELEREIDLGWIDAPYDGVVAACSVEVGDMVNAGTAGFEVFAEGAPVFEAPVPDRVAAALSVGAAAAVRLGNQEVAARIQSVSPLLDRSSLTRMVQLSTADAADGLSWTPGQSVEVRFRLLTERAGYWLPMSALQGEAGGLWSVYTVVSGEGGDELARRSVDVLLMEDQRVLIDGSVQEGELVVSDGVHRVVPGQRVSPVLSDENAQPSGIE